VIWIISGTKKARDCAAQLYERGYSLIATTTTDHGKKLLEESLSIHSFSDMKKSQFIVHNEILDQKAMSKMCEKNFVNLILDFSHPFSVEVSKNAIDISEKLNIPYVRYERESSICNSAQLFENYHEIVSYLNEKDGNILLAIGSNNIHEFSSIHKERLFVRVVPFVKSLETCKEAGILTQNIIAMQFPFSVEFNEVLCKELNIKYMVTKDSGQEGGVEEKIKAAANTGVEVLMLKRPSIEYPEVYNSMDIVLERVEELLHG